MAAQFPRSTRPLRERRIRNMFLGFVVLGLALGVLGAQIVWPDLGRWWLWIVMIIVIVGVGGQLVRNVLWLRRNGHEDD